MKIHNNKYFRWGVTAFLAAAASILFFYFVFHGSNIFSAFGKIIKILMPVVWGFAIGYILTPILNFIEKKILLPLTGKWKWKEEKKRKSLVRAVGVLCTIFLFVMLIYLLIYMLISQIVPSVQNIIMNFDSYSTNMTRWLNGVLDDHPEYSDYVTKTINTYSVEINKWFNNILPGTVEVIKTVSMSVLSTLGFLWDFIIGLIISIYVLASKERFAGQAKKIMYAFFSKETAKRAISNIRFTHETFIGFLGGKIVDSVIIGILCFIGTSAMKTPYAALVSVIIGVTNIIPFFGPFLGAVPSMFLIFIVNPLAPLNCLYFIIYILILQQVDGNIIGPKILGSSTGLTGFWVIFSITLFGGLFGVLGMIVGVPIFAVIYAAIRSIVNSRLEERDIPAETELFEQLDYIDEEGMHEMIVENRKKNNQQFLLKPKICKKKTEKGNEPERKND